MKRKSREEVVRYAEMLLKDGAPSEQKTAHHFGKMELRMLMDFIYDGPPKKPSEEISRGMWK